MKKETPMYVIALRALVLVALWTLAAFVLFNIGGCSWQGRTAQGISFEVPAGACGAAKDAIACAEDLSLIIELAKSLWEDQFGVIIWAVDMAGIEDIEITHAPFSCEQASPGESCQGLLLQRYSRYRIKLVQSPCLAFTSLVHELAHYFLRLHGPDDTEHRRKDVFYVPGSFEARARGAAIEAGICPNVEIK